MAFSLDFMQIKQGHRLVKVSDTGPVADQFAYTGDAVPFDPTGVYPVPDDPKAARYPVGSPQRALCDLELATVTPRCSAPCTPP